MAEIHPPERLAEIYQEQLRLMAKYDSIIMTGPVPYISPIAVPVNLNHYGDQLILKHLLYCILEETSEVLSPPNSDAEMKEEMVDILHFLVEFLLLSGISPVDLVVGTRADSGDVLEHLFDIALDRPDSDLSARLFAADELKEMLIILGNAGHELKNRPWKQTPTDTNFWKYAYFISMAFQSYIQAAKYMGFTAHELHHTYLSKNEKNHERQRTGY